MKLIDVQHEFFLPLWRRVAVVAVCFGWALFEFGFGDPFWGLLSAGIGAYCTREFFFAFNPRPGTRPGGGSGGGSGGENGGDGPG